MLQDLNYSSISHVLESWNEMRQIPDFEAVVGSRVLDKLVIKCPEALAVFGLDAAAIPVTSVAERKRLPQYRAVACHLVGMFEFALDLLGPDLDLVSDVAGELGIKHARQYGVRPFMYDALGAALLESLEELHPDDRPLSPTARDSWRLVYGALSTRMQQQANQTTLQI